MYKKSLLLNKFFFYVSRKFAKPSSSKWENFLKYCTEHKDEITAGTVIGRIGAAFLYFMENSGCGWRFSEVGLIA